VCELHNFNLIIHLNRSDNPGPHHHHDEAANEAAELREDDRRALYSL